MWEICLKCKRLGQRHIHYKHKREDIYSFEEWVKAFEETDSFKHGRVEF